MKKSLKDKIKYNFKEMWEDETEDEAEKKPGFRTLLLEVPLNFIRFELLYPKIQEDYDGNSPKGAFHALVLNAALGSYIGSHVNGEQGSLTGLFCGMLSIVPQMALGLGVRAGVESLLKNYKGRKERKSLEYNSM
jgi:hypothetical protein